MIDALTTTVIAGLAFFGVTVIGFFAVAYFLPKKG